MRKKIVGISVCMLLIATIAIPISAVDKEYTHNPSSNNADVPTWEVGDSWTYDAKVYVSAAPNGTDGMIYEATGEVIYKVIGDSGDSYVLSGLMKPIIGSISISGNLGMKITRLSKFMLETEFQKEDLAVIRHEAKAKGIALITIGSITLPIPIQMQSYRKSTFTPAFNIIPFPLTDGKNGTLINSLLEEESVVSMFWGLIPIEDNKNISWHIGEVDYTCNMDSITVEAGTYDVYNVSGDYYFGVEGRDYYRTYYAEEIGNVAKVVVHIDYSTELTYYHQEMELISTTYAT